MSEITPTRRDAKATLQQYMSERKPSAGSGSGRLLFGLDATQSRGETWATAAKLQADMFRAAGTGLSVKLCFFRGAGEFKATDWVTSGEALVRPMLKLEVKTGLTQIARILRFALDQHAKDPIAALAIIGDACEESGEELAGLASELGDAGLPVHMFLEGEPGDDNPVEDIFRVIASKSGGDFFWFGTGSPAAVRQFSEALNAVAKLAVGDASAVAAITHNN